MPKQKTKKAATAHGEVEYETVECENCENDMMVDDAVYVGIGLYEKSCNGVSICDATHNTYRESVALCEYCAENTVGYSGRIRQEINRPESKLGIITLAGVAVVGSAFGFGLAIEPLSTVLIFLAMVFVTLFIAVMEGM